MESSDLNKSKAIYQPATHHTTSQGSAIQNTEESRKNLNETSSGEVDLVINRRPKNNTQGP